MRQIIKDKSFDAERALYGIHDACLQNLQFAGPADGESALKEAGDLEIDNCHFDLRYPLWHVNNTSINQAVMSETCRAALWYDKAIVITDSQLGGIKALRECSDVKICDTTIKSQEFGWFCQNVSLQNCSLETEYAFLHSRDLTFKNLKMKGKYSFQYTENVTFEDCELDTKDAFWHSNNVTVKNCLVKGEYLAWYSKNLTLENCHIVGTQPLCYAENLRLINCTMEGCDLCFEKSSIEVMVKGHIDSVKGPYTGTLKADSIGEIIPADGQ